MAFIHAVPNELSQDLAPMIRSIFDRIYDFQALGEHEAIRRIDGLTAIIRDFANADFSNGYLAATVGFRAELQAMLLDPNDFSVGASIVTIVAALEPAVTVPATATQQQAGADFIKNTAPGLINRGTYKEDVLDRIITYLYFSLGSNFLKYVTPFTIPSYQLPTKQTQQGNQGL